MQKTKRPKHAQLAARTTIHYFYYCYCYIIIARRAQIIKHKSPFKLRFCPAASSAAQIRFQIRLRIVVDWIMHCHVLSVCLSPRPVLLDTTIIRIYKCFQHVATKCHRAKRLEKEKESRRSQHARVNYVIRGLLICIRHAAVVKFIARD